MGTLESYEDQNLIQSESKVGRPLKPQPCAPSPSAFFIALGVIFAASATFANTGAEPISKELRDRVGSQEPGIPKQLRKAGVTEKLGNPVDLSKAIFRDENDQIVRLSDIAAKGRPILLNLGYFGCTTLCGFVFNGMLNSLQALDWSVGEKFEVVSLSIDPREGAKIAAGKKQNAMTAYGRPHSGSGWHFLTGQESQIRALADAVGFGYEYDPRDGQYAHSAVLTVLTPDGRVSRYLYGIEYSPTTLKLALLEASNGKIGTIIDRILLFCYRYDETTRKFSLAISRVMQTAGAATTVVFGGYLTYFWTRERRRREDDEPPSGKGV